MTYRALNAGDLTHKAKLYQKTSVRSPSGAQTVSFVLLREVWAAIEPLNGKEYLSAQQIVSKIQTKARIRLPGNEDVNATMCFEFKGIRYNIEDVLPDERFVNSLTLMLSSFDVPNAGTPSPTPSPTPTPTPSNSPPTANFSSVATKLSVAFTDSSIDSDGTIASWAWNFGDSNTSTLQNPTHVYAAAGTYTVHLTVTDNLGATNTKTASITVVANVAPVAGFTHSEALLVATFTDASTDSDGTIASRSWNFGDSNTSTSTNPVHTYASAGTYTVSLQVTDNNGATNTVTHDVTVSSGAVSPSLVATANGQSTAYTAALSSSAFDTQSGDLVVGVVTSSDTVAPSSFTDTAGNTFLLAETIQGTGDYNIATSVYYTLSSNAKTGNVATANFPGSEPHYSSLLVAVFRGGTWTYDSTGSAIVTHPSGAGPISSGALATAGAGVLISAVSSSEQHSSGPTKSWAFSNGTLAIDEQLGTPAAIAAQINTGAVSGPFTATGYNTSGGNPTSNINGNAAFASFLAH